MHYKIRDCLFIGKAKFKGVMMKKIFAREREKKTRLTKGFENRI